ncbi:patatin-like phospholipase family protein [Paludibacterium paludis]|uniref:PNPLA domain-containing protein n=1 Tax=Paludibacterium paludis TaxID=1225769 RepID=A0A918P427_9NEIS|nr:patatin-like phospholipase family protein [Paludibacterium paludis]GGY19916.1 hypothetical protein GCM10011289_24240 [Paludibacterium paludis]
MARCAGSPATRAKDRRHAATFPPGSRRYRERETPDFASICFSGGGAKGLAYLGILARLGDARLERVRQVSGALTAIVVATGLPVEGIRASLRRACTKNGKT